MTSLGLYHQIGFMTYLQVMTSYEMELGFYDVFTSYEMEVETHVVMNKQKTNQGFINYKLHVITRVHKL